MAGGKPIPLTSADLEAIQGFFESWKEAWLTRNWEKVMALCTDDITIMTPGEPTTSGPAFRAWLETFPEITALDWRVTHSEGTGQLAVIQGNAMMEIFQDGETVRSEGRYCDIFRKDDNGNWLMACINWMPDKI